MLKRLLTIFALILLPAGAWADDATPAATPTPTTQSGSLQPSDSGVGGSSADSTALQPAGGTNLGASNTGATDLTAPTGSNLQGTTNASDQIKTLLSSEADGAPQSPNSNTADYTWLAGLLVAVVALAGVVIWWVRRRQLARASARFAHPDADR